MVHEFINAIKTYFADPTVQEICLNGTRSICIFKEYKISMEPAKFLDGANLIRTCQEFALSQGQRLDMYCPSAGGQWENGAFRWHCLIPPASVDGAIFTLRRHRFSNLEISDFKISPENGELLTRVFQDPSNHILFCGPTGSGKTSLLSAFLKTYAIDQRVILIEDHAELAVQSHSWLRLLSRRKDIEEKGEIKLSFLIEESLRLRPDRIVIGEIRTLDSLVFFETILLGHHGSLSTIHGSEMSGVHRRINALVSMRKGSVKNFWSCIEGVTKLWYVFMERGSPPSIVGIHSQT